MGKKRILIVEDEVIIAHDIMKTVEDYGYEVVAMVASGDEAIKLARDDSPDLILMDIVIEGEMNGIETAGKISEFSSVPIIYLTSFSDRVTLQSAKNTGPYGYILKPFEERELNITIDMAFFRQKMEGRLQESEEKYRTLVNSIQSPVCAIGRSFEVLYCNEEFGDVYHTESRNLVGVDLRNIDAGFDGEWILQGANEVLLTNTPLQKEGHNGSQDLLARIYPTPSGVLLIFNDITERKKNERELFELNNYLEQRVSNELLKKEKQREMLIQKSKLESLGKLSAGIAHEINQPLSGISMGLDNVLFKMKQGNLDNRYLNSKIDSFFEDISRIRQIIQHIRIFSREQKDVISSRVDLNETIKNALSMVKTQYGNHHIDLVLNLAENSCFTVGNKYRIEQVLLNLLSNAKDAVEEKAEAADCKDDYIKKIELTSFSKDKKSYILIKDNGIGIEEGDIEHIFEPFYTTKDEESGTGLGLSIVYGILEEMKANLKVRSEVGNFTEMILEMPIDE